MLRRALSAVALLVALFAAIEWRSWPDVEGLVDGEPESTAFIDAYRRQIGSEQAPQWDWVPYSEVSEAVKMAVVVAEDIGFFDHQGFATEEIEAALRQAWAEKRLPRGASTLSQQLAKNLWLSPSRNPWRKAKEALLTWQLERTLSKRRILELYLNVVEFGRGIYGVEAAARHYFGRSASALGPREASMLAASLPRPASWHPGCDRPGYEAYVATVRRRMQSSHWLSRNL